MKLIQGLLSLLIVLQLGNHFYVSCQSPQIQTMSFEEFQVKFNKTYSTQLQRSHRKIIFQQNLKQEELANLSDCENCGVTKFFDWTKAEEEKLRGEDLTLDDKIRISNQNSAKTIHQLQRAKQRAVQQERLEIEENPEWQNIKAENQTDGIETKNGTETNGQNTADDDNDSENKTRRRRMLQQDYYTSNNLQNYPSNLDWRAKGVVTPSKDQTGLCGSCWAFVSTGLAQSYAQIHGYGQRDLSEQFLLKCTKDSGCKGGYSNNALDRIIEQGGMPLEVYYPYHPLQNSTLGICKPQYVFKIQAAKYRVAHYHVTDQQIIRELQHGPIIVPVQATFEWNYYTGDTDRPFRCNYARGDINHAVLLVGYTQTYWIVKNSWGADWGKEGFMYITRDRENNANCRIGYATRRFASQGVVKHCEQFNGVNGRNCLKCKSGYYQQLIDIYTYDVKCLPCNTPNCQSCYNTSYKDKWLGVCHTCDTNYSLEIRSRTCEQIQIESCITHYYRTDNNALTCYVCEQGYVRDRMATSCNKCQVMDCVECQRGNGDECKVCQEGFVRSEKGICQQPNIQKQQQKAQQQLPISVQSAATNSIDLFGNNQLLQGKDHEKNIKQQEEDDNNDNDNNYFTTKILIICGVVLVLVLIGLALIRLAMYWGCIEKNNTEVVGESNVDGSSSTQQNVDSKAVNTTIVNVVNNNKQQKQEEKEHDRDHDHELTKSKFIKGETTVVVDATEGAAKDPIRQQSQQ